MENRGEELDFVEERRKLGRAVVAAGGGKLVASEKEILVGSVSCGESYMGESSTFRAF